MNTARLQVVLRDVEPAVARVVDVPASSTLPELHQLLQAAIGWQRGGQPIDEQDVRMAIAQQSPIMKGLDLINNADLRAWATGASALSLLPGATMSRRNAHCRSRRPRQISPRPPTPAPT